MTARLFYEPAPDRIAHTATSAWLATNQPLHDWALYICKEAVAVALNMVEATEKWPSSTETNQTAFNIALQTDLPFFAHLKTRPEHLRLYSEYQKAVASTEGLDLQHLVHGYDWQALGKAQIVDVRSRTPLSFLFFSSRLVYPCANRHQFLVCIGWWINWPFICRPRNGISRPQLCRAGTPRRCQAGERIHIQLKRRKHRFADQICNTQFL